MVVSHRDGRSSLSVGQVHSDCGRDQLLMQNADEQGGVDGAGRENCESADTYYCGAGDIGFVGGASSSRNPSAT